jgi:hypothetical protein
MKSTEPLTLLGNNSSSKQLEHYPSLLLVALTTLYCLGSCRKGWSMLIVYLLIGMRTKPLLHVLFLLALSYFLNVFPKVPGQSEICSRNSLNVRQSHFTCFSEKKTKVYNLHNLLDITTSICGFLE